MRLSRRDFLKLSGAGAGGLAIGLGFPAARARAQEGVPPHNLHKKVKEIHSVCAYCAVGCGLILATENGRIVNCEGDPDHPINLGRLDPKSVSTPQLIHNDRRLTRPLYRAPGSDKWEEKSWDWMLTEIAKRIQKTRDETFVEKVGDVTVNRTEAIAWLGGAANNNEECYLATKLTRALGMCYIEHQARI